jgi:beta-1,4-mannosyl-glycoprotein beta-1,4-N-acetylglucosaminyltransferase
MIITASPFFNELDLLEVKLYELQGEVDAHVIVESELTFTGLKKPLFFWENRKRFEQFKIEHFVCNLPPRAESPWVREQIQYQTVRDAVLSINPAIVLWVDADEIPKAGTVARFLETGNETMTLEMDMLLFYFDRIDVTQKWHNGKIGRYNPKVSEQPWRGQTNHPILKDSGWHCEFFGGKDHLAAKLRAVSHAPEEGCRNMLRLVESGRLPGIERTEHYPTEKRPKLHNRI